MREAAGAALLLGVLAGVSPAQNVKPECAGLLANLDRLISIYAEAGSRAIDKTEPGPAMDQARREAIGGSAEATVTMVGIGVVLRGRGDSFPVEMIRQVCTYADRNGHPLHVATCAYFNTLNPLGDRERKRIAAEAEIARFDKARKAPPPGRFSAPDEIAGHVDALKACLVRV